MRRQGLNVEGRLGGALDLARAVLGKAVGDEQIADFLGDDRLEDRFLELRPTLHPARADFELVAVLGRQNQALGVVRRIGAAVVVRAGFDLRLGLGPRQLRRIHRQLGGERVGFLACFWKLAHVAAAGRNERRADVVGLRLGSRRVRRQPGRDGDAQLLGRRNRAAAHHDGIAGQVDDGRYPSSRPRFRRRRGGLVLFDACRRERLRRAMAGETPADQAGADAEDHKRTRQGDSAAASGHRLFLAPRPSFLAPAARPWPKSELGRRQVRRRRNPRPERNTEREGLELADLRVFL